LPKVKGAIVAKQERRPGRRVQLHRAVSKLGWGSRGQAWDWIVSGSVRVDGRIVTDPLTWVDLDCQRITRGEQTGTPESRPSLILALHKPRGIVTTRQDERGRKTIYDLLPADLPWIFPAGRLDADSEGLLILTNDAELSVRLTEPAHAIAKTYRVTVSGCPTPETLDRLRHGIELSEGRTRPAEVRHLKRGKERGVLEIVLREGRNRQIRRMLSAVGHRVRRLVRVAIGGYGLGELPSGAFRWLGEKEREALLGGGGSGGGGG
jgi:23S rRNA pseudouridine2605 synthase